MLVRSTDTDRTLMSGQVSLAGNAHLIIRCPSVECSVLTPGLFPPSGYMEWSPSLAWQPVPVHTVPQAQDLLLNPGHSACPRLNTLRREVEEGDFIRRLMADHESVRNKL